MQPPARANPATNITGASPPQSARAVPDEEIKHGAIGRLSADEELQQTVCEALIDDTELDSSDIRVSAAGDTVVLSGSVSSNSDGRRALQIAQSQRGVASVQVDALSVRRA